MNNRIEIIDYHPRYTEQTIAMWRASKELALGMPEMHDIEAHRYFLNRILAATHRIYLAVERRSETVLGMIAADDTQISQLYVHPGYQHQGIGSSLVEIVKDTAGDSLTLYTFEVNAIARKFWQKHGFVERRTGLHDNEEGMVDVLCEWRRENSWHSLHSIAV